LCKQEEDGRAMARTSRQMDRRLAEMLCRCRAATGRKRLLCTQGVRTGPARLHKGKGKAKGAGVGAWLQLALRGALVAACAREVVERHDCSRLPIKSESLFSGTAEHRKISLAICLLYHAVCIIILCVCVFVCMHCSSALTTIAQLASTTLNRSSGDIASGRNTTLSDSLVIVNDTAGRACTTHGESSTIRA
jgi:hypothetical protein